MKTLEVDIEAIQAHRKQLIEKAEKYHQTTIASAERMLKELVAHRELCISNDKAHFKKAQDAKQTPEESINADFLYDRLPNNFKHISNVE
jgi:F0F1-type ATP synthase membrane subunit b/b'